MSIMSKTTAAYLAGFLDGEGSFGIRKSQDKYYVSRVRATNTNKEIIEWMHKSFGGSLYFRDFKSETLRNAWTWTLEGKSIVLFLKKVIPYLKIKKAQAQLLLKREELKLELENKGHRWGMVYPEEVLNDLEKLFQELKRLNKRGKSLHAERLIEETGNRCDSPIFTGIESVS